MPTDGATIPGAMERVVRREVQGGLIEFEEAPTGWLTKANEPRKKPWRAYYWTDEDKRKRQVSVTTMLDLIVPKPGLAPWSEAKGIEGLARAVLDDVIVTSPEQAVKLVRRNGWGAEAARDDAATRGLNLHALLEEYMRTGSAPVLADHPQPHWGYIAALSKWLLKHKPEPVAIEQLVCNPEEGYAGRLDLRAVIAGELTTVDLKSQERAGIYLSAHLQVGLYERAAVRCGDPPAEHKLVVVVAANGEYRAMPADHSDAVVDATLDYYRAVRPIDSLCESANRAEYKLRKAA